MGTTGRFFIGIALAVAAVLSFAGSAARGSTYSNEVQSLSTGPSAELLDYYQFADASAAPGSALSGTTADSGADGNTGIYHDTPTVGSGIPTALFPGMAGDNRSVDFNSSDITASDAGLPTSNAARTVTEWINTSTAASFANYQTSLFYGTNDPDEGIFLLAPPGTNDQTAYGTVAGNFGVTDEGNGLGGTSAINDGNWHFLALTVTPTTAGNATFAIYVDGAMQNSAELPVNTVLSSLEMGSDPLADQYDGQLAQVAIYNYALSGGQIESLYDAAPEPGPAALFAASTIPLTLRRRRDS
jgi:hypothetical protein